MNTTSAKKRMLVTIAALVFAGAPAAARADEMAGMKMDNKAAKGSAPDSVGAKATKGAEKLEVAVTDKGFEPDKLQVRKGQLVEIVFTRKTDQTCIKEVVLDTGAGKIQKPLPLNKPVAIKTTFAKAGDLKYACNMNMFTGTITVQ
jgi:plastocyanin domain-containing protein